MTALPSAACATPLGGPHLDDAALLRWLDGEPDAADTPDALVAVPVPAAEHAAVCARCAARADVLRARRARLSALLRATDAPAASAPDPVTVLRLVDARRGTAVPGRAARPPWAPARPAWRARPGVRLAAAGVALAAASLTAQPVRHWVSAQWARLTAGPVAPSDVRVAAPALTADSAAHAAQPPATVVSFTPEPGPFTVRFDARPAGGTLRIVAEPGVRASATVTGSNGAVDLMVLPAGLRVRNRAGSATSYQLTVPAAAGRVRLHFAAPLPATDTAIDLAGRLEVVVPLGGHLRARPR